MDAKAYSELALRTAKQAPAGSTSQDTYDISHAFYGLVSEVGEIADAFKRHAVYEKPLDLINLGEEIGDVCWYLNLLIRAGNESLPEAQREVDIELFAALLKPLEHEVSGAAAPERILGGFLHALELLAPHNWDVAHYQEGIWKLATSIHVLCRTYGLNLEQLLEKNIQKLAVRYGDKYSDYAALNRDTQAERRSLES